MANVYDNYDYEPETPKKEVKKTTPRKKGGVGGKILCLALGFVVGITCVPVTVGGAALIVGLQPIDKTVDTIDAFTNMGLYETLFGGVDKDGKPTAGILNPKYSELKIKDLVEEITEGVKGLTSQNGSLADLDEISPYVGDSLDNMLKGLEKYGVYVDTQDMLDAKFKPAEGEKGLGDFITEAVLDAKAGDLFRSLTGSDISGLLEVICYGEEGIDWIKDAEGNVVMLNGAEKTSLRNLFDRDMSTVLDKITVETIITPDLDDSVMCALAYGPTSHYRIEGNAIFMNQVEYTYENGIFYDDQGKEIITLSHTVKNNVHTITVDTGRTNKDGLHIEETQYVLLDSSNLGYVYSDAELTTPYLYRKMTIGELGNDSMALFDNLLLKDVLDVTPSSSSLLLALAYGVENEDYILVGEGASAYIQMLGSSTPKTIGDLRLGGEDLLFNVSLADIMDEPKDSLTAYFLYGKKDVHYEIQNGSYVMKQKFIAVHGNTIYNEYGEKLDGGSFGGATYTDEDGRTYRTSAYSSLLTEDGTYADTYYLYDLQGEPIHFSCTTIGSLINSNNLVENLTKRVTIGEVITEKDLAKNRFLAFVADSTITNVPNAINQITIQQAYAKEITRDVNGNLTGKWKYLLTENGVEKDYNINNLDKLLDNMTQNIEYSTLNELVQSGMLTGLDNSTLSHKVISGATISGVHYSFVAPYNATTLGDLTVSQAIDYMNSIFTAIDRSGIGD